MSASTPRVHKCNDRGCGALQILAVNADNKVSIALACVNSVVHAATPHIVSIVQAGGIAQIQPAM